MDSSSKTDPDVTVERAEPGTVPAEISEAPRSEVGTALRLAREESGLSLYDVASVLRIRPAQLHAIEAGRFDDLPGMVYAVGFVRTYAEFLGFEPAEVVHRFREEFGGADHQPDLVFPAPPPEGRVPGGAVLLIAVVLAILGYGGWYYLTAADHGAGVPASALPERFAHLLSPAPGETPVPPALPPGEARPGGPNNTVVPLHLRTPATPAPSSDADRSAPALPPSGPVAVAEAPSVPPLAPPAPDLSSFRASSANAAEGPPAPPPSANGDAGVGTGSRILIRAVADSWVQISDGHGGLVMTRLLRPGDTYQVPATDGLEMLTGNAGGLEILVNGRPIPPLGGPGAVIRDIALDADRLSSGTALRRHHN